MNTETALENIKKIGLQFEDLENEIKSIIAGNEKTITFILMGILCDGHILLEGVPGVAKTTIIKTITKSLGLSFQRIQFTPDLLPADLIGTLIYNPKTQDFETKKGPIFGANFILADEINRSPAKVQSALLEAMQEQQVTIGSNTFALHKPFIVFATQNPLEQEGTYRLPEAQIDRFMFKLIIDYLDFDNEKKIIYLNRNNCESRTILDANTIDIAQALVKNIYVDEKIIDYITSLVFATRQPENFKLGRIKSLIEHGVSPRATLALYHAAQAHAFLKKRHFVIPDDVKNVCHAVMRHRISLSYQAEADRVNVDNIIDTILNTIPTP